MGEGGCLVGRARVAPSGPECVAHRAFTPINAGIKRTAATSTSTSIPGLSRTEEEEDGWRLVGHKKHLRSHARQGSLRDCTYLLAFSCKCNVALKASSILNAPQTQSHRRGGGCCRLYLRQGRRRRSCDSLRLFCLFVWNVHEMQITGPIAEACALPVLLLLWFLEAARVLQACSSQRCLQCSAGS